MTNSNAWARNAALCALLSSVSLIGTNALAKTPEPPGLFAAGPRSAPAKLPEQAIAGRSHAVEVNHYSLRSSRFSVNLPGGISLEAVRDQQQDLGQGRFSWVGHADGDRRNRVVIGVSGDAVAATFSHKGKLFKLEPRKNGDHVVSEVSNREPAPELDPVPVADTAGASTMSGDTAATDGSATIDVLVAYTPKIAAIYGESGADALIIQAVAETNQAYTNSSITARLNLVHSVMTSYTESGNMNTDLGRLRSPSDGYMDELHTLRDAYGADMVSLIEDEPQYCGIAYRMTSLSTSFASSAFSVVHRTCATGYYSFGHELGHNQGLHHDPANASGAMYAYAYGYQEPFNAFRSVMAYNCSGGCNRVDQFSNPNVLLNGEPTGAAGISDNARAHNTNAATVASFRQQAAQNAPSAPDQLSATVTGSSSISLSWQDTSDEESGFNLERSTNGVNFTQIASLVTDTSSYVDDNLAAETLYYYRVQAWNSVGNSDYSPVETAVTEVAPPFIEQVATADMPVAGSVSGTYQRTWANDNSYQTIQERESGGKKRSRYGYLEHKWVFDIQPGNSITLSADVTTTTNSDSFAFSYSTDNSSYLPMFTVNASNSGAQLFVLPSSLSGNLYIRVRDNVRNAGDSSSHSVQVDHLTVRSDNAAGDPPNTPSNLASAAAGPSQIQINWVDMSENEHGFAVERSIDSSGTWLQIATAGANATSYSDSGLNAATLYNYRVHAFNGSGKSANSNTHSSVTDDAPASTNIELSARQYKVKGVQQVDLTWTGSQSATVDIYRDGSEIDSAVPNSGSYTDNINRKGGGSYSYEICDTGTSTCSNTAYVVF